MCFFLYLRRALSSLRAGVGGPLCSVVREIFQKLVDVSANHSDPARPGAVNARLIGNAPCDTRALFNQDAAVNTGVKLPAHSQTVPALHALAILPAASLKRNGPLVPARAGGNA